MFVLSLVFRSKMGDCVKLLLEAWIPHIRLLGELDLVKKTALATDTSMGKSLLQWHRLACDSMSHVVAWPSSLGKLYLEPPMHFTPEWMIVKPPSWMEIVELEQSMLDPPINITETWAWYQRSRQVERTCWMCRLRGCYPLHGAPILVDFPSCSFDVGEHEEEVGIASSSVPKKRDRNWGTSAFMVSRLLWLLQKLL
jgi:hypothetical protein